MASDSFMKGMNAIIDALNEYNSALPHIEAIEKELSVPCEESPAGALPPAFGDLVFHDVSFSFPGKPVFEHLNLTIRAGEKVLVSGANGRGKSTLFGLLLGFYRPQSGVITLGGADIAAYPAGTLCRLFGYIPQQAQLLSGSAEENLALCLPADHGKTGHILRALRLENIRESDPLRCSMGEKQRLGIGRALYQGEGRPILLGDEIFANVDAENRDAILEVLRDFGADRTVLFICHEEMDYPFTHRLHLGEEEISYRPLKTADRLEEVRA